MSGWEILRDHGGDIITLVMLLLVIRLAKRYFDAILDAHDAHRREITELRARIKVLEPSTE